MTELWQASASDLARLYAAREASPVEALASCLRRLDAVNPALNALVLVDRDGAAAAAAASEARWTRGTPIGPLDGVPVTVKDSIRTAGLRSTFGSRLYGTEVPDRDETPVTRVREAGGVVLGKTNVPEFTVQGYTWNPSFGVTRNPWDPALTPGGSSGGAVAAVAAGIGPPALATDGGGSIRRPASHGGLVGLKPTAGRVPRRDGFPPVLLDFEVIGPIARTVADLATAAAAITAPDPGEAARPGAGALAQIPIPSRKRILYVPTFADAPVDPEIAASVAEAAGHLAALGHDVEEGRSFTAADRINALWPVFGQVGIAWLMGRFAGREDELGPDIRAIAEAGAGVPATAYFDALEAAVAVRAAMAAFFGAYDLLLTPSAAALPWTADATHPTSIAGRPVGPRGSAIFTGFVNAAGCPGISIPCRPSAAGLPIGFQLVGPWGADEVLIGLAAGYEAAHPWPLLWDRHGSGLGPG